MSCFVLFLYAPLAIDFVKAYELHKQYDASNFFDSFDFINTYDKYTHGRALYVAKYDATSMGLARTIGDQVFLGVDNSSIFDVAPYVGRKSVRVESHDTIDNGIITVDFEHLPANACGMWPAFWLVRDDNEYEYSEIDIIESVSLLSRNEITLYTKPSNCTKTAQRGTGEVLSTSCAFDSGCGTQAPDGTFGDSFNKNGGGIWATQIEAEGVRVWYFPRSSIPADLESDTPDPDNWGEPVMSFAPQDCDIRNSWKKMKIILNITFCGEYAGGHAWDTYTQCRARTGVDFCDDYVAQNPSAFDDVYFLLNSIKIYNRWESIDTNV